MNLKNTYDKQLFGDLIEELKWFEEEFNELYLYIDVYSKKDINQAIKMINFLKARIESFDDDTLDYLLARTLKRIENIYPEFFHPEFFLKNI
ncbi:MAG: hypothetical protein ACTSR8_00770 [Promethearchaeota archaeon]